MRTLLCACLLLASCATSKPEPACSLNTPGLFPVKEQVADNQFPDQIKPVPSHANPAFFLSTPEGSARRQARKDVRAAKVRVPFLIGKGAVNAPQATEVVNGGNKSQGPTTNADSGAVVTNTQIEKNKAPAAIGDGATATSTEQNGLSWWWLLVPVGIGALWLYRKTLPFA